MKTQWIKCSQGVRKYMQSSARIFEKWTITQRKSLLRSFKDFTRPPSAPARNTGGCKFHLGIIPGSFLSAISLSASFASVDASIIDLLSAGWHTVFRSASASHLGKSGPYLLPGQLLMFTCVFIIRRRGAEHTREVLNPANT